MTKTPEEIKLARQLGAAKAREIRMNKVNSMPADTEQLVNVVKVEKHPTFKTIYFDETLANYNNFVKGLELGIKQLDIRSPTEYKRAIPLADEFVKLCKEKYPQ